jgi:hypothetical protein
LEALPPHPAAALPNSMAGVEKPQQPQQHQQRKEAKTVAAGKTSAWNKCLNLYALIIFQKIF